MEEVPALTSDERRFLAWVRLHESIGYGRMMQIISHEWWRHDSVGALTVGPCYGLLKPKARREAAEQARGDRLFTDL